jgi:type I restriction enzyme S subunit
MSKGGESMKDGWKIVKLGEVCEIFGRIGFRGYTTKDLVESPHEGAISLSPSNIVDGRMDYSKCTYISWYKYNESPEIMIFNGDILLVKTGSSYGKSALVERLPHKATINPQSVVLKNFKINNKFLAYQIRTKRIKDEFDKFVSGTAIPTFSQAKLSEVQIFCPPLEEQHRIVSILDASFKKIDALKKNAEENLKNAKALFQQVLAQELKPKEGWVEKKLGEIYDVRDGTHDSPKYHSEGYPLVTSKNLKENGLDLSNVKYIKEEDFHAINTRSKVNIGDILFAMIGTIGNPVIVREEPNYAIKNMALFKVDNNNSSDFLRYYLLLSIEKMRKESNGTTQKFVSLNYLRNFGISLPSLTEQHRIVRTLDTLSEKCRRLEQVAQQTIRECDALKQSILRKAFSGEL